MDSSPSRWFASRWRVAIVVLWLVVTGLLVARALHKARRAEQRSSATKTHGAIERNQRFALRVWRGEDPYATPPLHAPYPPSYGIVLGPLAILPTKFTRVLWVVLQMLVLVAVLRALAAWWQSANERAPPPWVFLAAILLVSRYLLRDTHSGGGNLVWAGLVLWTCLQAAQPLGADSKPWRGLGLGIVLAAKPTPILFVPWLWINGRRKTVLVALASAVLLHLVPIATLGLDGWSEAYARWFGASWAYATQSDVFATPAFDFPEFSWMNQSLRFAVARFTTAVPSEHAIDSAWFFGGLGLSHEMASWITRALSLGLVAVAARALWQSRSVRQGVVVGARTGEANDRALSGDPRLVARVHAASIGLLFALTLLLSPITWKSHHVQLLPAFFVLLAAARARRSLTVGLAVYFVCCNLMSQEVIGKTGKEIMQSLYVVTWGALWVFAAQLGLLQRASADSRDDLRSASG